MFLILEQYDCKQYHCTSTVGFKWRSRKVFFFSLSNKKKTFSCYKLIHIYLYFVHRFRELLRRRLIECGWRDQVRMLCREAVKENESANVTFDMLVTKVTPRARALIPDTVKKELLQKIKTYLLTQKDQ